MTGVYRFASCSISKSDGMVVIGEHQNSFFSSPVRLFFEQNAEDGISRLLLVGVKSDGKRNTEFISVKKERTFTKEQYVYVEKIEVQSRKEKCTIVVKTEQGSPVCVIPSDIVSLQKVEYYTTESYKVISYGASGMENANTRPLHIELVSYDGNGRKVLHAMFLKPSGGTVEKSFVNLTVQPQSRIVVESKTEGTDVIVSAWFELEKE